MIFLAQPPEISTDLLFLVVYLIFNFDTKNFHVCYAVLAAGRVLRIEQITTPMTHKSAIKLGIKKGIFLPIAARPKAKLSIGSLEWSEWHQYHGGQVSNK
jgi:hypothetical protein